VQVVHLSRLTVLAAGGEGDPSGPTKTGGLDWRGQRGTRQMGHRTEGRRLVAVDSEASHPHMEANLVKGAWAARLAAHSALADEAEASKAQAKSLAFVHSDGPKLNL
jgi:hypothetical protein